MVQGNIYFRAITIKPNTYTLYDRRRKRIRLGNGINVVNGETGQIFNNDQIEIVYIIEYV
jgi:hypothetical protein